MTANEVEAIVAAIARAVRTRRSLEASPWRGVLRLEVTGSGGSCLQHSIVVADDVYALPGAVAPPGLPAVTLRLAGEALVDLVRGRRSADDVWKSVVVDGDTSVLAGFAAATAGMQSWLSLRSSS